MSDSVRLAVLGDPLAHTLSPALHQAGMAWLGVRGESHALRTAPSQLAGRLSELASAGFLGANVTQPLKGEVIAHLHRVSDTARRAGSVNTVGFGADEVWGDTTDGAGLIDLLGSFGRRPPAERAVLIGAGGAARSLAIALGRAGASVAAVARDVARASRSWPDVASLLAQGSAPASEALATASLVVNCTPLSGPDLPVPPAAIAPGAMLLDLTYGVELSPWVRTARATGRDAWDGLGLLVHQARRSLGLWFERNVPIEPLARAAGWPR